MMQVACFLGSDLGYFINVYVKLFESMVADVIYSSGVVWSDLMWSVRICYVDSSGWCPAVLAILEWSSMYNV